MEAKLQISEMFSAWENEEMPTSLARAVYLTKAKLLQNRELTKEEERLFAHEVSLAKAKEIASFCANEAMEFVAIISLPVRP